MYVQGGRTMALLFTEETFEEQVEKGEGLFVIDFYADWCGPCKMMAPIIEELAEEYKDTVKIGKLNVDDAPSIAQQYRVMSIPTVIFLKDGKVLETIVGLKDKAVLKEKVEQYK